MTYVAVKRGIKFRTKKTSNSVRTVIKIDVNIIKDPY